MLLLSLTLPVLAAEPVVNRPNVVLIVADDLGWADLGCYGSRFHRTPHLDRMAAEGCRFTQAYAACPVCSPTRAALMTGKYPARLGLTDWLPGRADRPDQRLLRPVIRQQLPLEERTLAEVLKAGGYATAHHRQVAPRRRGLRTDEAGVRPQCRRRFHGHAAQLLGALRTHRTQHAGARVGPRGRST